MERHVGRRHPEDHLDLRRILPTDLLDDLVRRLGAFAMIAGDLLVADDKGVLDDKKFLAPVPQRESVAVDLNPVDHRVALDDTRVLEVLEGQ